jgi:hypothetical protein
MQRLLAALIFGCLTVLPPVAGAADKFVPGTEDVPLMPGLRAVRDGGVVFDKPQGRIVEASVRGHVTKVAVIAFYRSSLPQLGWTAKGERRYLREGEALSLEFTGHDGNLTVAFTLAPQ